MKRRSILPLLFVPIVAIMFGGFMLQSGRITVKGSDTMVILAQRWAEVYMSKHGGTAIQVTGGGSGTGISALINGTTDIANSSRPIKRSEVEKLKGRFATLGVEIPCAKDGLAVYLNDSNPVQELTLQQIKDIYT
ncbi:MAG: substrate-binding domain-containing protein, partial [Bacteroidota bacterium]